MKNLQWAWLTALLTSVVTSLASAGVLSPAAVPLTSEVETEVSNLRQAYVYLEAGNHDYKGHRVRALRAVGSACNVLGFKAKGDGRNHEVQTFSDNLLASARQRLTYVEPQAQALGQNQVVGLIQQAIQEIELAMESEGTPGDGSNHKRRSRR
jgi:hypothetical protein